MTDKYIKMQQEDNLKRLIKFYDYDRSAVADALGVSVNTVYGWVMRGRISAKKSIVAERVTGGAITKSMLRPDVKAWIDEV